MSEEITQWEYRVETVGGLFNGVKAAELEEMLDEWGEDGWEVVAVHPREYATKIDVIAKRPLTDRVRRGRSRPSLY